MNEKINYSYLLHPLFERNQEATCYIGKPARLSPLPLLTRPCQATWT